jgi:hypothetical protein
VPSQRNDELHNFIKSYHKIDSKIYKMKKVTVELTEKMDAAVEAFKPFLKFTFLKILIN